MRRPLNSCPTAASLPSRAQPRRAHTPTRLITKGPGSNPNDETTPCSPHSGTCAPRTVRRAQGEPPGVTSPQGGWATAGARGRARASDALCPARHARLGWRLKLAAPIGRGHGRPEHLADWRRVTMAPTARGVFCDVETALIAGLTVAAAHLGTPFGGTAPITCLAMACFSTPPASWSMPARSGPAWSLACLTARSASRVRRAQA